MSFGFLRIPWWCIEIIPSALLHKINLNNQQNNVYCKKNLVRYEELKLKVFIFWEDKKKKLRNLWNWTSDWVRLRSFNSATIPIYYQPTINPPIIASTIDSSATRKEKIRNDNAIVANDSQKHHIYSKLWVHDLWNVLSISA